MIKINVYEQGGDWFGARWVDGKYDGCDELDLPAGAGAAEAIAYAAIMPMALPDETPREISHVQGPPRQLTAEERYLDDLREREQLQHDERQDGLRNGF